MLPNAGGDDDGVAGIHTTPYSNVVWSMEWVLGEMVGPGGHMEWGVWGWDRELIACFRGGLRGVLRSKVSVGECR